MDSLPGMMLMLVHQGIPSLAHSFSIDIMVSSINWIEMQQDEPWWWNGRLGWKNDECCVLPAMTRGLVRGWRRLKNVTL
jgi:hypothetical protein